MITKVFEVPLILDRSEKPFINNLDLIKVILVDREFYARA